MDKNLLEILNMLYKNMFSSQPQQQNKAPSNSYPPEAYSNYSPSQQPQQENNFLPLIMSLLNKNGSLNDVLTQNTQKKEDKKSPYDEILL